MRIIVQIDCMRLIIAVLLIVISLFTFMVFVIGSHGKLQFRYNRLEDWVFGGLIIIPTILGICIIIRKLLNRKNT